MWLHSDDGGGSCSERDAGRANGHHEGDRDGAEGNVTFQRHFQLSIEIFHQMTERRDLIWKQVRKVKRNHCHPYGKSTAVLLSQNLIHSTVLLWDKSLCVMSQTHRLSSVNVLKC